MSASNGVLLSCGIRVWPSWYLVGYGSIALDTNDTRPLVVLGFFGTTLDAPRRRDRWKRWRPTLSILQHDDLLVDRLDLLCSDPTKASMLLDDIAATAPETEVQLHDFQVSDFWDFEAMFEALHTFVRDYPFDIEREQYLVHITTGTHVAQICLFLLVEAGFIPAQLLQSGPPRRRSDGPSSLVVIDLNLARYDRIAGRFEADRQVRAGWLKAGIPTKNGPFNALIDRIERVASVSPEPILLSGPTGAGKTRLARRLYDLKRERGQVSGPLVEVNCATLRGDQAMSALFGHCKGAFTGALADRKGLLANAHNGVVFLDEIGELGTDEQAMLLTAIEDGRFVPLGSDRPVDSDFQLIAGTNRDLGERVAEGAFRQDLLARINLWHFALPALADRREDIGPNIDYELERLARRTDRRVTFNTEARRRFEAFARRPDTPWRNNFRDLSAAITRMSTLAPAGRIRVEEVNDEVTRLRDNWGAESPADAASQDCAVIASMLGDDAAADLDLFEQAQLAAVIRVCKQHPTMAASGRTLFAQSRLRKASSNDADRLRKYLARFGLSWSDFRERQ